MDLPKYSVVIPAYNAENTLKMSVLSVLNQTYLPFEIIIVDDKSSDNTILVIEKLIKKHPIIKFYKNEKNLGVAETRNFAFSKVNTAYIALLDSDDLWAPEKMEIQLAITTEKNCDVSFTGYTFMGSNSEKLKTYYIPPKKADYNTLLKENYIGCSSVVFKTSLTKKYKMRSNYSHEDFVFWLELMREGNRFCSISKPLMIYRLSPNSRSGDKIEAAKNRWLIYRDFLKMDIFRSIFYFIHYSVRGFKKHKF